MKQFLVSVGLALTVGGGLFAQNDLQNLQKYWKLRNDFREKFVKIGSAQGESLPARMLKPTECIDTYESNVDGTTYGITQYGEIKWGDGMIRQGYYLGLLATEYRLLKDAGQDVTGVLNELYYALNAINRLDINAEFEQGLTYDANFQPSLNGFYMREDIPEFFAQNNWGSTQLAARCVNSPHYKTNNSSHLNQPGNGFFASGNSYQNSPSSDQFSSLLLGFSLIHKLVDASEFVQPPGEENGFYIVGETQAIVDRMVNYLNEHNWMMIDVNGWPVNNGGGDVFYAAPMIHNAAMRITGHDYSADWKRHLVSFVIKDIQQCITGYGLIDNSYVGQTFACYIVDEAIASAITPYYLGVPGEMINDAYWDLLDGVPAGIDNNQATSVFQDWLAESDLNGPYIEGAYNYTSYLWPMGLNLVLDAKDDGKLSALPGPLDERKLFEPGDAQGDKSSTIVLTNYGVAGGVWTGNQLSQLTSVTGNMQLELINAVIRGEQPPNSKEYYKGNLDGMSPLGPFNLLGKGDSTIIKASSPYGWAAEHKWTWTSTSSGHEDDDASGIYNGLDYMLYYNLYHLFFKNTLPTFQPTEDCFCTPIPYYNNSPATLDIFKAKARQSTIQPQAWQSKTGAKPRRLIKINT